MAYKQSLIKKAVIPAGGYGTRMLPITKAVPKEMLPIIDKPIIQFVIEELVEAGIEDIIVVTTPHKNSLIDYFGNTDQGLVENLQSGGGTKEYMVKMLEDVRHIANFAFVEQHGPYGTGTPVLNAKPFIDGQPFIYTFADDFFISKNGKNSFVQMIEAFADHNCPIVAAQKRDKPEDYEKFGYIEGEVVDEGLMKVKTIFERPKQENAPSNLASISGFIVTPEVIEYLEVIRKDSDFGNELYFHSALTAMSSDNKQVIAKEITDAVYYDTGNKLEYIKTVTMLAADHPEIGEEYKNFLNEYLSRKD